MFNDVMSCCIWDVGIIFVNPFCSQIHVGECYDCWILTWSWFEFNSCIVVCRLCRFYMFLFDNLIIPLLLVKSPFWFDTPYIEIRHRIFKKWSCVVVVMCDSWYVKWIKADYYVMKSSCWWEPHWSSFPVVKSPKSIEKPHVNHAHKSTISQLVNSMKLAISSHKFL